MSGKIISVFCFKGGVGKTTLSILLAHGLVNDGKRVLVIDLDESPMASEALFGRNALTKEIAAHNKASAFFCRLMEEQSVSERSFIRSQISSIEPRRGQTVQLSLMPGTDTIAEDEDKVIGDFLRGNKVGANYEAHDIAQNAAKQGIIQCAKHFDYVIVDCPPRPSNFCKGAIEAADLVLVPYMADEVALNRVASTARLVENVTDKKLKEITPEQRRYLAVPNRVDTGVFSLHTSTIESIRGKKHPHLSSIKNHKGLAAALQKDTAPLTLSKKYSSGGVKIINKFMGDVTEWLVKKDKI